jgi:hypothetical protein
MLSSRKGFFKCTVFRFFYYKSLPIFGEKIIFCRAGVCWPFLCLCRPFIILYLRAVWIRTQSAAVASGRANILAIHVSYKIKPLSDVLELVRRPKEYKVFMEQPFYKKDSIPMFHINQEKRCKNWSFTFHYLMPLTFVFSAFRCALLSTFC